MSPWQLAMLLLFLGKSLVTARLLPDMLDQYGGTSVSTPSVSDGCCDMLDPWFQNPASESLRFSHPHPQATGCVASFYTDKIKCSAGIRFFTFNLVMTKTQLSMSQNKHAMTQKCCRKHCAFPSNLSAALTKPAGHLWSL